MEPNGRYLHHTVRPRPYEAQRDFRGAPVTRMLIGLVLLGVLAAACATAAEDVAEPGNVSLDQAADASTAERSSAASHDTAVRWPEPQEDPPAAMCVHSYPEDLDERPYAFDGTVVSVSRGEHVEEAAGTPLELKVEINEAFNGDLASTVTLHTWDFAPESEATFDPTGARILVATGDTMDVMACGFTRPYSVDDAELWRTTFSD